MQALHTRVPNPTPEESIVWSLIARKATQSLVVIWLAKLVADWILGSASGVSARSWSVVLVTVAAIVWTVVHVVRRHRRPIEVVYGAAVALPLVALLAGFEWFRKIDGERGMLGAVTLCVFGLLGVATVLYLRRVESPRQRRALDHRKLDQQARLAASAALSGPAVTAVAATDAPLALRVPVSHKSARFQR